MVMVVMRRRRPTETAIPYPNPPIRSELNMLSDGPGLRLELIVADGGGGEVEIGSLSLLCQGVG